MSSKFLTLQYEKQDTETKKFTEEEKLTILQEVEAKGLKVTMDKYGLFLGN